MDMTVIKKWESLSYDCGKLDVTKLDNGSYTLSFHYDNGCFFDISVFEDGEVSDFRLPTKYRILRESVMKHIREAFDGVEDVDLDQRLIIKALEDANVDRRATVKMYKYYDD